MGIYELSLSEARGRFPEFEFVNALTPSAQKAAFHVRRGGRDLCLKILAPNAELDRVRREITALRLLNHPRVARLVEYVDVARADKDERYIVEEYIEGEDFASVLQQRGRLPRAEAAAFFAKLCDGLHAIHSADIVHRDLKPANIRVRSDGEPVIVDFGWARLLTLPDLTTTAEGAGLGTPAYFAPEQWTGTKHDVDHRTDLFALGVMLYEALCAAHPYLRLGMRLPDLSAAVCDRTQDIDSTVFKELPKHWQLAVRHLLAKDGADRPHSAEQVQEYMQKLGGV